MKKKVIIYGLIVIGLLILAYFLFIKDDNEAPKFTFTEVKKGDISNTITSTGTLNALKTIDVGTQVSGKLDKIFVDYNSDVKKGELLAILDTTNLSLAVRDAQSNLTKAQSQYEQAKAQHDNNKILFNKGFMSELDFITSKTNLESAIANLQSAKTSLDRAKTNLAYAYIYSPIYGKVINKNVEEGQTVAASFSSPTLFEIAENLSKMQILASVDESDIGKIKVGQEAKFSVQSYPNKEFTGEVVQIRLNSEIVQNVVNYSVVINADNKSNLLLPGMTATIDFYVEQKNNVLMVPNAALRFQPTEDMLAEYQNENMKSADSLRRNIPDSIRNRFRRMNLGSFDPSNMMRQGSNNFMSRSSFGRIWYLDNNGKLQMTMAVLGLTDGKNTEIVRSRNLKDSMKVITGMENSTNDNNTNIQNRNFPRGFGRF
jgi:HlyD family secretion protein